jgi:hypothetical protein
MGSRQLVFVRRAFFLASLISIVLEVSGGSVSAFAASSCPAPAACQKFTTQEEQCKGKSKKACRAFVKTFKKLLPKYDCQHPFDTVSTEKYFVPAVWLCDNYESALKLLSRMKTPDAKAVFGSSQLQKVLDGDMAKFYMEKSQKVAKQLKAGHHPAAAAPAATPTPTQPPAETETTQPES